MRVLDVKNLTVKYGFLTAVKELSFSVDEGETVVLSGPNGSGKSSILMAIMGIVRAHKGNISYKGNDLHQRKPWERARMGIGILPEGKRLFDDLSIRENFSLAADHDNKIILKLFGDITDLFPTLRNRISTPVRLLSGGERQVVALARMLCIKPKLALLDDPLAGLAPNCISGFWQLVNYYCPTHLVAIPDESLKINSEKLTPRIITVPFL